MRRRMAFAGGSWKPDIAIRGYEVDANWADVLKADPEMKKMLGLNP
jgi:hypothetical protein